MTCEVMLMNLEGVALAADSAVTITHYGNDGRPLHSVSQVDTEKIFILSEPGPMAAMIYGGARFADYPWKPVFQAFTAQGGHEGLNAADTASRLVAFLGAADAGGANGIVVPEAAEVRALFDYVADFVRFYRALVVRHAPSGPDDEKAGLTPALEAAYERLRREVSFETDYVFDDVSGYVEKDSPRAKLTEPGERLNAFLLKHLGTCLDRCLDAVFARGLVSNEMRQKLWNLVAESVVIEWLPPSAHGTGIVVAGYGGTGLLPAYAKLDVRGAFGGVLQHRWSEMDGPEPGAPVVFRSYAQDELIRAFVNGAQGEFIHELRGAIGAMVADTFDHVVGLVAAKDKALSEQVAKLGLNARVEIADTAIYEAVRSHWSYIGATLGSLLSAASIEGLARHAARLVQLSVLEHELTGDGSVAKPITMLKMTKGKHQFDIEGKA